ncbi:microfibril-associated glycoprotein 4-like [Glandiceps talaboti]
MASSADYLKMFAVVPTVTCTCTCIRWAGVFILYTTMSMAQVTYRGSDTRSPVVCNPQNYIQVDVPKCPANETILGIVTKLDSLEQSLKDLGQTLKDPNKASRGQSRDCFDLLETGHLSSGSYVIQPDDDDEPIRVHCDMDTDSGGWTVFQRRMDGRLDFFRDWQSYKSGFGHVNAEFWLGNDKLFRLTNQRLYQLRVDMEDFEGNEVYALYGYFSVGDEFSNYKLTVGNYSGTSGDSFSSHSRANFSTKDAEQGGATCAATYKGGWWYTACHSSNLNGLYLRGEHESYADGVEWGAFKGHYYSLKLTEMKIRPVPR